MSRYETDITFPESVGDPVEVIAAVYELANSYIDDRSKPVKDNSEVKTPNDFETFDQYWGWRSASQEPLTTIEDQYEGLLGIIPTNNLYLWFVFTEQEGRFKPAYDIGSDELVSERPGIEYLRKLKEDEPDLFAATVKVSVEQWLRQQPEDTAEITETPEERRQQRVQEIVAKWSLKMHLTESFTKMLGYAGEQGEEVDKLCG
jgi:hypothetical protein